MCGSCKLTEMERKVDTYKTARVVDGHYKVLAVLVSQATNYIFLLCFHKDYFQGFCFLMNYFTFLTQNKFECLINKGHKLCENSRLVLVTVIHILIVID